MTQLTQLATRSWLPPQSEALVHTIAQYTAASSAHAIENEIEALVTESHHTHRQRCINLNPASNVMNPRAEALLSRGLGNRPSLGYPAQKFEMGLEAIERIEVITQELAAEIFDAKYVEYRAPSGAIANLSVFMALAKPGDTIISPAAEIGGHVTHHAQGAAGRYGLNVVAAPMDAAHYTIDTDRLRELAHKVRPTLITAGGSLTLFDNPISEMRKIADEVGAYLVFDAAHLSGIIAGNAWPNPLNDGAHVMTMSTYKSLGGPPGSLILTNDPDIAQRIEKIVFPGLTANFDVAKTAALGISLLDWKVFGHEYANAMVLCATSLAHHLIENDVSIYAASAGGTKTHQLAIRAGNIGNGHDAAVLLSRANLLTSAIGLPAATPASQPAPAQPFGIRLGTPEIVRWGMNTSDMPELAKYIADALLSRRDLPAIAADVQAMRQRFDRLHFIR